MSQFLLLSLADQSWMLFASHKEVKLTSSSKAPTGAKVGIPAWKACSFSSKGCLHPLVALKARPGQNVRVARRKSHLPPFCLATIKGIAELNKFCMVSVWENFAGGHLFLNVNAEALDSTAIEVVLANITAAVGMTGRCIRI
jgi:hypothetical protein